jgi:hypothetical protein
MKSLIESKIGFSALAQYHKKNEIRKQIKIVVGIDVQNSSLFNEFVCKLGFFWMSGPV